jgi:hypothetical protein
MALAAAPFAHFPRRVTTIYIVGLNIISVAV